MKFTSAILAISTVLALTQATGPLDPVMSTVGPTLQGLTGALQPEGTMDSVTKGATGDLMKRGGLLGNVPVVGDLAQGGVTGTGLNSLLPAMGKRGGLLGNVPVVGDLAQGGVTGTGLNSLLPAMGKRGGLLGNVPVVGDLAQGGVTGTGLNSLLPAMGKRGGLLGNVPVVGDLANGLAKRHGMEHKGAKKEHHEKSSTLERRGHHSSHASVAIRADLHVDATVKLLAKLVDNVVAKLDVHVRAELTAKIAEKIKADTRIKIKANVDIEAKVESVVEKLLGLHLKSEHLLKADVDVWVKAILDEFIKVDANVKVDDLVAKVKIALDAKIQNLTLNLNLGSYGKALANIKALGLIDAKVNLKADVNLGLKVDALIGGIKADIDAEVGICVDALVKLR